MSGGRSLLVASSIYMTEQRLGDTCSNRRPVITHAQVVLHHDDKVLDVKQVADGLKITGLVITSAGGKYQ